jgi:hypothetical protein
MGVAWGSWWQDACALHLLYSRTCMVQYTQSAPTRRCPGFLCVQRNPDRENEPPLISESATSSMHSLQRPLARALCPRLACALRLTTTRTCSTSAIDGTGSTAVVMGGFRFTERQLLRHSALYTDYGFNIRPVLSDVKQLCSPAYAREFGPRLADELQQRDEDLVFHAVSGSFWHMTFTLAHMDPAWREKRVKAIMFDSCAGFFSWFLQTKFGIPGKLSKQVLAPLLRPVIGLLSEGAVDTEWLAQNERWCFGDDDECVFPRSAVCLLVRGRNDPVLEGEFVDSFAAHLRRRTKAQVESRLFERAQHAMGVVDAPDVYKKHHVEDLLGMVPEWRRSTPP